MDLGKNYCSIDLGDAGVQHGTKYYSTGSITIPETIQSTSSPAREIVCQMPGPDVEDGAS